VQPPAYAVIGAASLHLESNAVDMAKKVLSDALSRRGSARSKIAVAKFCMEHERDLLSIETRNNAKASKSLQINNIYMGMDAEELDARSVRLQKKLDMISSGGEIATHPRMKVGDGVGVEILGENK